MGQFSAWVGVVASCHDLQSQEMVPSPLAASGDQIDGLAGHELGRNQKSQGIS